MTPWCAASPFTTKMAAEDPAGRSIMRSTFWTIVISIISGFGSAGVGDFIASGGSGGATSAAPTTEARMTGGAARLAHAAALHAFAMRQPADESRGSQPRDSEAAGSNDGRDETRIQADQADQPASVTLDQVVERLAALERLIAALHDPSELDIAEGSGDSEIGPLMERLRRIELELQQRIAADLTRRIEDFQFDFRRDLREMNDRLVDIERELDRVETATGEPDFHQLIRDAVESQNRLVSRVDDLERELRSRDESMEQRNLERDLLGLRTDITSLRDRISRLERDR